MDPQKALQKVAQLCSQREMCEFDIRKKLTNWEISYEEQNHIIQRLYDLKFIDEQRYTFAFVRDKANIAKWGIKKIELHLKQKRISSSTIQLCLRSLSQDEQVNHCIGLLKAKDRSIKDEDPYKRKAKLIRFLLSKGYTMDQALSAESKFRKHEDE